MKKEIFSKLIQFFKKENIEYCILGNVSEYPTKIGSDVDIVINSRKFKELNSIINQFISSNSFEVSNVLQHEIEGKYFVVSTVNNQEYSFGMLALDFCANYMVNGSIVLTDKELLESKKLITNNGIEFWVCSDEMAFVYYLYKKIIKQSITKKQFQHLHNLWIQNRDIIINKFYWRFSEDSRNALIDFFDKSDIEILNPNFFKILKKEIQKKHEKNIKTVILEFRRKVFRFLNPTGVIIHIYKDEEITNSDLAHLIIQKAKDFEAFRSFSRVNLLGSNSKSNFKWLNFIYQFWFIVYPLKVRSKLVILEGYSTNLRQNIINTDLKRVSFLERFVSKLIPKPDLFFFVDTNKETEIIIFEIKKTLHNYLVNRYNKHYKEY